MRTDAYDTEQIKALIANLAAFIKAGQDAEMARHLLARAHEFLNAPTPPESAQSEAKAVAILVTHEDGTKMMYPEHTKILVEYWELHGCTVSPLYTAPSAAPAQSDFLTPFNEHNAASNAAGAALSSK